MISYKPKRILSSKKIAQLKTTESIENKIIHGDTLEVLKKIPDNSIKLIVTSPSYYLGKKYEIDQTFDDYLNDLDEKKENLKFSDLELIFKDLKQLFEKRGFIINWKALEKQSLDETINALAMASPFSLEEKQVLLEAINLDLRKNKIAEILSTYTFDEYNNTTLQ